MDPYNMFGLLSCILVGMVGPFNQGIAGIILNIVWHSFPVNMLNNYVTWNILVWILTNIKTPNK